MQASHTASPTSAVADRHARILSVMKRRPYLTYAELAALLGVSPITVRRDIARLEGRSPLKAAVGGAINMGYLDIDLRLDERA